MLAKKGEQHSLIIELLIYVNCTFYDLTKFGLALCLMKY